MKELYSLWVSGVIQLQRLIDHIWRHATGFPALSRSMITPNLYLGGQYYLRSITLLKRLGVTGIISMRMREVPHQEVLRDFHLLHLPTPDRNAPTLEQLQEGVVFIEKEIKNSGKVYIHCRAGEGRGPTMALAYLIYSGMTYDDAYALVKKIRTFINPTPAQIERLQEFEKIVAKKKKLQ